MILYLDNVVIDIEIFYVKPIDISNLYYRRHNKYLFYENNYTTISDKRIQVISSNGNYLVFLFDRY